MLSLDDFAADARAFLDAHAEPRRDQLADWGVGSDDIGAYHDKSGAQEQADVAAARSWRRTRFDAGFGWITGPVEHGGRELTPRHEQVYVDLEADYDIPRSTMLGSGVGVVAPTLWHHGDRWMLDQWVRPLLRADLMACQLLSEPEAGSDLPALRTRAERDGDEWVVTGQKVWTSSAHLADLGLLLARTDPDEPRHRGLTTFVLAMDQPGVEVRPLRQMTGGSEFNEVFLDGARIPDRHRIGPVDEGWRVITTTLANERAAIGTGSGYGAGGLADMASPRRVAQLLEHFGLDDDPIHRQDLARLWTGYQILRFTALRTRASLEAGRGAGPWAATSKLFLTSHLNWAAGFVGRALGPRLVADSGAWGTYVWSRLVLQAPGMRIGGGTDEILRNTIAERVLGLPREPRPERVPETAEGG